MQNRINDVATLIRTHILKYSEKSVTPFLRILNKSVTYKIQW